MTNFGVTSHFDAQPGSKSLLAERLNKIPKWNFKWRCLTGQCFITHLNPVATPLATLPTELSQMSSLTSPGSRPEQALAMAQKSLQSLTACFNRSPFRVWRITNQFVHRVFHLYENVLYLLDKVMTAWVHLHQTTVWRRGEISPNAILLAQNRFR